MLNIMYLLVCCSYYITTANYKKPRSFHWKSFLGQWAKERMLVTLHSNVTNRKRPPANNWEICQIFVPLMPHVRNCLSHVASVRQLPKQLPSVFKVSNPQQCLTILKSSINICSKEIFSLNLRGPNLKMKPTFTFSCQLNCSQQML